MLSIISNIARLRCLCMNVAPQRYNSNSKRQTKSGQKIDLSAFSYDTIRRCYFLFGLSIFFISLKLVFNSFFKSGIFFSCGKCSGPFPVLSITMFLTSLPTL